jgi:hypothetical protein
VEIEAVSSSAHRTWSRPQEEQKIDSLLLNLSDLLVWSKSKLSEEASSEIGNGDRSTSCVSHAGRLYGESLDDNSSIAHNIDMFASS